jgi:predicted secreted protein with PEFG-CTERM motif
LIIQIETFSDGDLLITLPKTVIDTSEGDFFVLVDGEETVFYAEQTPDSWTLRIPFYNGSEEIEIIGTFVIPEFGTIVIMIFVVGIISMIAISAKTKLNLVPKL